MAVIQVITPEQVIGFWEIAVLEKREGSVCGVGRKDEGRARVCGVGGAERMQCVRDYISSHVIQSVS